jgi:SAM-dependent methyltransferase
MIQGDFLDYSFGDKTFDVIHMNHIFEHFDDPILSIEKVRRFLGNEGIFVIEVPNQFDNVLYHVIHFLRRLNPRSFSLYSIHHPFFYTPKNLALLLQKNGFLVVKLSTWKNYIKVKSGSFYPGASTIEHFALLLGDLLFKGGLFIEVYARNREENRYEKRVVISLSLSWMSERS